MTKIKIKSYPKINLTLDIMGKDHQAGKHFVNTFFYRVEGTLFDEIILEKREDNQNFIHCENSDVPLGNGNSVITALELIGESGWDITIHKKIPVCAGLAGGSSNAGVVLKYFSDKRGIPIDHISELSRKIGADVPFFLIDENLAYAEGFGDQILQSWKIPIIPVELIPTGIRISTVEAYAGLDLNLCACNSLKTESLLNQLKKSRNISSDELKPFVHNDFETSFFSKFPGLKDQGHLCGSGGGMWRFF